MNGVDKYLDLFHESMVKNDIFIPNCGVLAGWPNLCERGGSKYERELISNSLLKENTPEQIGKGRRNKFEKDSRLWEMFEYDNMHFPLGGAFFQYGIPGIIQKIESTKYDNNADLIYMNAVLAVYQDIFAFIEKHAVYAQILLEKTTMEEEKTRLQDISNNCKALIRGIPSTLAQALQLFWFIYIARNPYGRGCIGRLDQSLYPFYELEKKKGHIDNKKVLALIKEFYKNLNKMGTGDTLRNLMLSGQNEKDEDETNELTYLFL